MRIVKSSTAQVITPTAIALGNFDGIHLGHQQVILSVCAHLSSFSSSENSTLNPPCATVVTFDPHPREFFSGQKKALLTPLPEKVKILEKLGIQQLVLLPFSRELAQLSPQEFVQEILVKRLEAKYISVGEDFRFGHQRSGDANTLQSLASCSGITVQIISLQTSHSQDYSTRGDRISSSGICQALARGEIVQANRMLGRAYSLTGKVLKGQQLGRTIGFPTANLELPCDKLLPRYGVYAVKVYLEQGEKLSPVGAGVMNIGTRPTVEGNGVSVEVHLLDWSGELYGQTLTVSLEAYLRGEQKFASLEALKNQITMDCEQTRKILSFNSPHPPCPPCHPPCPP